MIVRELLAKLGFDFEPSGADAWDKRIDKMKSDLLKTALAAFSVTKAFQVFMGVVGEAGRLNDLAQRTGIAAEALQELEHAAKLNGVGAEALAGGMGILARTMHNAAKGSEEAQAGFAAVGVGIRKPNGELKTADEMIGDVAEKFAAMPNGTKKAALAMQLFGRSGAQLIPMLNLGRKGLEAARIEARELGIVMGTDAVNAGDELGDNIDRLKGFLLGLARTLAGPLLEPLSDVIRDFLLWARANREVIKTRIHDFARALIATFRGLAAVISFVQNNMRLLAILGIAVLTGLLIANAGAVATAVTWYTALGIASVAAGLKAAAAWALAAAPAVALVVILAALLLIAEDIYVYLKGGDSLIGELGPKWTRFLDEWSTVKGGEPEWLLMLKSAVTFVSDLATTVPKAVADIRAIFADWFSWLIQRATEASAKLLEVVTHGLVKVDGKGLGARAGAAAYQFANSPLGGSALTNPLMLPAAIGAMFGGGASPAASVQTSAKKGASISAPINMPINVTGVPGQDATAVAGEVRKQVDEALQQHLNAAAAATN